MPSWFVLPGLKGAVKHDRLIHLEWLARHPKVCFKVVRDCCCDMMGVTIQDFELQSPDSNKPAGTSTNITVARHLYFYLMRRLFKVSFRAIGQYVYEDFNHTSVMYGNRMIKEGLETGRFTQQTIIQLEQNINEQLQLTIKSNHHGKIHPSEDD